jgi:hypothetical protein
MADRFPSVWQSESEVLDEAFREIHGYSVDLIIVHESVTNGSGTLVASGNIYGILTARHVVETISKTSDGAFALMIEKGVHRFRIESGSYELTTIGPLGGDSAEGPDLAFVLLTNQEKIEEIQARKHFYPLSRGPRDAANFDMWKMPWAFSGSPRILSEPQTVEDQIHLRQMRGGARLIAHEFRGECDYLTVGVHRGLHNFPTDYGGVSGGGLWIIPTLKGPEGWTFESPLFAGVIYYQVEISDSEMNLVGHGLHSLDRALFPKARKQFSP